MSGVPLSLCTPRRSTSCSLIFGPYAMEENGAVRTWYDVSTTRPQLGRP